MPGNTGRDVFDREQAEKLLYPTKGLPGGGQLEVRMEISPDHPDRDVRGASIGFSARSASRAFSTNWRRSFFSSSADRLASPTTCTIPFPSTVRLAPTIFATGRAAVICTVGIPAFSSSVVIAAPLRVLVPQVDVTIIASMPKRFAFSAISRPIRRVFDSGLAKPEVDRNSSWSLPMAPSFSNSRITSSGTSRSGSWRTNCAS